MKVCTKCGCEKSLDNFRVMGDRYHSWCKECEYKANKARYVPKEKKPKIVKDINEIKLSAKIRMLKHRYNITLEEYNNLYIQQDCKCAICKNPYPLGGTKGLLVDHNHSTGKVRGLLCRKCNVAIGLMDECKDIIVDAMKYLGIR